MKVSARLLALIVGLGWLAGCAAEGVPPPMASPAAGADSATATRATARTVGGATSTSGAAAGAMTVALPPLARARAAHTATLLADGSVLVAGGFAGDERGTATGPMVAARQSHTATLLPDGRVLVAGGFDDGYLASAELYDPATGRFSATGPLTTARSGHVAVLLATGKVLLVGGVGTGWTFLASAELYDPATGRFAATGAMGTPRESHTATLLPDGRVLVAGGHRGRRAAITIWASAEVYDPRGGGWTATGALTVRRHKHDATLLADGRVFISGGADERDERGAYATTELYDPATGGFVVAATLHAGRYKHTGTSVLLADGRVLLLGGAATAEVYDPATDTATVSAAGVGVTRLFATATALRDHSILFVGGYGPTIAADSRAWLIRP